MSQVERITQFFKEVKEKDGNGIRDVSMFFKTNFIDGTDEITQEYPRVFAPTTRHYQVTQHLDGTISEAYEIEMRWSEEQIQEFYK